MKCSFFIILLTYCSSTIFAQSAKDISFKGAHINFDNAWSFAFGHPFDTKKDFDSGTGYFSYLAKAGYGDGAAAADFDDRSWRKLDLPHDWGVEAGFSDSASFSHGFKGIGRKFPDKSVGWYRKTFNLAKADSGKRITIAFDGVFRNSIVWFNGHYLGTEASGYNSFEYDVTDLLNFGKDNTVVVRADATMEEGWFYEGAGIYRHVWLNKTSPLHVATHGICIATDVNENGATVKTNVVVQNSGKTVKSFSVLQKIYDRTGRLLATNRTGSAGLESYKEGTYTNKLSIAQPKLWSVDTPYLHRLVTTILVDGIPVDEITTKFGVRTIRFDANEGFFLNGKRLEIKGTNNHQDHAGLGTAIPDELQYFRIATLKEMGSNAYRCSHNPPTPELLDACDSLGMLVIDENRLMGTGAHHLGNLKKLIERDRNHPSIISWSIGNEEWGIENNSTGAHIASSMQSFVKSLDTTRAVTAGFSGGWGQGLSAVVDLMGYNYIAQENPDAQHQKFPLQKGWGTEEGSTFATRGIYFTNDSLHYKSAYDAKPRPSAYSIEEGWKYYAQRPFLAGMFIWTGFDYRGEPTPYGWPSTGSYFGMLDQCGFPKDDVWYLRSWWGTKPLLHLLPHWNLKGHEGENIDVWAYSNCEEVELWLKGKSQGKKTMQKNGHLQWQVPYSKGTLKAVGYLKGKIALTETIRTTGEPSKINLVAAEDRLKADGKSIRIITVSVLDKNGLSVPDADNDISFSLSGPGKIIGIGNGDPTSRAPDQFLETLVNFPIQNLKELAVFDTIKRMEIKSDFNSSHWNKAFTGIADTSVKAWIYRGSILLSKETSSSSLTFFYQSIGRNQSIYFNGHMIAENVDFHKAGDVFKIDKSLLKVGENSVTMVVLPIVKIHSWDALNTNPGVFQFKSPAAQWKRKLFNGLAQIIVKTDHEQRGEIKLTATAAGLKTNDLIIKNQ